MATGQTKSKLNCEVLQANLHAGLSYSRIGEVYGMSRQAVHAKATTWKLKAIRNYMLNEERNARRVRKCAACASPYLDETYSKFCEAHRGTKNKGKKCTCGNEAKVKGMCLRCYDKSISCACVRCGETKGRGLRMDTDVAICGSCYRQLRYIRERQLCCSEEDTVYIQYLILQELSNGRSKWATL